jgi:hypothetical protein
VNVYTILRTSGAHEDAEADFYEAEGNEYVFYAADVEVYRVSIAEVSSVSKARGEPPPRSEDPGVPLLP